MITIGDINVCLTMTEFSLLFPLRYGTPTTYAELAEIAYSYAADEKVRVMMDKHIDRIRSKLRGTGIYIYCILNYGYLLLPEVNSHNSN
jgi:DNA-binding response OmpR family regulator